MLALLAFSACLWMVNPVQARPLPQQTLQSDVVPLSAWGYKDVTLRGPFAQAEYSFGLPMHWQVQPGSSLQLNVSFLAGGALSQAQDELARQANIQVRLNGISIYETFTGSGDHDLNVALPDVWPARQGDYDRLEVFLRDYGPCEDALFSSLSISAGSFLTVRYLPLPLDLDLSNYPAPFFQRSHLPNETNLILPDEPSPDVLQAALSVAAGLGSVTGNRVELRVFHASQVDEAVMAENLIVVGTPENNSLIGRLAGKTPSTAAETDGVLRLVQSPERVGKAALLVTGATDEGVRKAGLALSAQPQFLRLAGQEAVVQEVHTDSISLPQTPLDLTFTDLGYTERVVTGIGRKDIYYNFDLPLDWNLTSDAGLRLKFSHSPLLDGALSSITVFLNDVPIGSARLDGSNAVDGELIAPLPPESSQPGLSNTLLVQIEADLPDPCILPETSTAWVTLSAESSLYLAHTGQDLSAFFNLDFWPRPFNQDPQMKDVLISLPSDPTNEEYTVAFQIAAFLGSASQGRAFEPALLLGDPGQTDLASYHLVLIGRPSRSPLLQSINDQLPQPFIPGVDTIEQTIDSVVYRLQDGLDLGFLELVPSQWNSERILIVITGTSDAGLQSAADFLMNSGRIWELKGNLAMVRGDRLFVTDTRVLTGEGQAAPVATAVTEITPVAELASSDQPGNPSAQPPEQQTLLERFPWFLPALTIASLVVVVALLGLGYWMSRRGKGS